MNRTPNTISFYRKKLPHWEIVDGLYFITLRRQGSLSDEIIAKIRKLSDQLEKYDDCEALRIKRKIFETFESALDKSEYNCDLVKSPCSEIIMEAIRFYSEKQIWRMIEFVIMPNHIHMFFECKQKSLGKTMLDFKKWTTRKIKESGYEFSGESFWHREWFDHWSRSSDYDEKFKNYILNNPVKAGLVKDYNDWKFGSWNKSEEAALGERWRTGKIT